MNNIVTFTADEDRDGYRKAVEAGLEVGKEYTVTRVDVFNFHSRFHLEGFSENFNTVLFDKNWQDVDQSLVHYD